MSGAPEKSRKIGFVELEGEGRDFFSEALGDHDLFFARRLENVPEDVEIVSVFIGGRIDEAFLARRPALRLIATRSTGCDHIDLEACARRGVAVTNVGSYGENSVAEHTFALILALSRKLREAEEAIETGKFNVDRLRGFDLRGKTLGIIGAGRIGLHVARIGIGFGMTVLAYDAAPHFFYTDILDFQYASFEEVLKRADVLTLHIPLTAETRHLMNRETLALCRDGILLINTSRGGLMDSEAILEALDSGKIAGLGLDVLEDERVFQGGAAPLLGEKIAERVRSSHPQEVREPSPERLAEFASLVAHSRLLHRPDVILTPHIAYNSQEAARHLRAVTLESIRDFLAGKPLRYRCL